MSFFQRVTQTVQIDAENSVQVRKLNYGERQQCISRAMSIKAGRGGVEEIVIDAALIQMETLKHAIVSWSGPGFEGRPVTPGNVEELPGNVADMLTAAVDALNPQMTDAEKKA